MKKTIWRNATLLFLGAILSGNLFANDVKVRGIVIDSLTREGEPFATIRIYPANENEEAVSMGTTDMEGRFEQTLKDAGSYHVLFSSVGRKSVDVPFVIPKGQEVFVLDTIFVTDDVTQLAGVEIVAQRPLVKMEVDKLSYSVESDIDAKSNSVLDMLRKVPMVSVDGNDQITVNGSSSFKVYVDGKPNVMMSSNPSEIFKNMPASSIKDIEVITNPGARYDAEGVGGVLNLVTDRLDSKSRQQLLNNYNVTVRGLGSNRGAGGGIFFSMQKNKFSMSVNANAMESFPLETTSQTGRTQYSEEGNTLLNSNSSIDNSFHIQMGNINMSYEIDSLNLLSASAGLMGFGMDLEGTSETRIGSMGYASKLDNNSRNFSINGSIDYQHLFAGNKERMLTVSYLINTTPQRSKNYSWFYDETDSYLDLTDRYSHGKDNTMEHTWQADFSTPLAPGHKLDLGAKYILRNNTSRSDYYDLIDSKQVWNESNSLDYDHRNNILAGYAEYSGSIGRFSLTAGLRYEHTWQKVEARLGQSENFKLDYGNLVPSANVSYKISDSQNIGAAYNMRISRPGITMLNPFVDRSDPTSISYGNTDLDAEKAHNISLVYNLFTPEWVLNLTLRQSLCDNGIEQYSFYDGGNILNTTYGNITRSRQTGLNAFVNWNATGKTRFMLNGSIAYVDVRSSTLDWKNHGWQGNIMFGYQQTLPWDVRLSANIMASTKTYSLQGWNSGFNTGMLSLSKSLLKDKLNITLTGVTPLNFGKMKMDSESASHDFYSLTHTRVSMQSFVVSISYTFGGKVNVKKTQKSISNTDVVNKRQEAESIGTMILP